MGSSGGGGGKTVNQLYSPEEAAWRTAVMQQAFNIYGGQLGMQPAAGAGTSTSAPVAQTPAVPAGVPDNEFTPVGSSSPTQPVAQPSTSTPQSTTGLPGFSGIPQYSAYPGPVPVPASQATLAGQQALLGTGARSLDLWGLGSNAFANILGSIGSPTSVGLPTGGASTAQPQPTASGVSSTAAQRAAELVAQRPTFEQLLANLMDPNSSANAGKSYQGPNQTPPPEVPGFQWVPQYNEQGQQVGNIKVPLQDVRMSEQDIARELTRRENLGGTWQDVLGYTPAGASPTDRPSAAMLAKFTSGARPSTQTQTQTTSPAQTQTTIGPLQLGAQYRQQAEAAAQALMAQAATLGPEYQAQAAALAQQIMQQAESRSMETQQSAESLGNAAAGSAQEAAAGFVPTAQGLRGEFLGAVEGMQGQYLDPASNPYFQAAQQAAIDPITRSFTDPGGIMSQIRTGVIAGGGLGGTRQAIAESLAAGEHQRAIGDVMARMGSEAYNTGLGLWSDLYGQGLGQYGQTIQQAQAAQQGLTGQGLQNQADLSKTGLQLGTGLLGQGLDLQAGLQGRGLDISSGLSSQALGLGADIYGRGLGIEASLAQTGLGLQSQSDLAKMQQQTSFMGMLPGFMSAGATPGQQFSAVGAQQENLAQQLADYEAASRTWDIEQPWNQLENLASVVFGAGSSQSTSSQQSAQRSPIAGALGGALAGAGIAGSVGWLGAAGTGLAGVTPMGWAALAGGALMGLL